MQRICTQSALKRNGMKVEGREKATRESVAQRNNIKRGAMDIDDVHHRHVDARVRVASLMIYAKQLLHFAPDAMDPFKHKFSVHRSRNYRGRNDIVRFSNEARPEPRLQRALSSLRCVAVS